jgi:hypothetical protein
MEHDFSFLHKKLKKLRSQSFLWADRLSKEQWGSFDKASIDNIFDALVFGTDPNDPLFQDNTIKLLKKTLALFNERVSELGNQPVDSFKTAKIKELLNIECSKKKLIEVYKEAIITVKLINCYRKQEN